MKTDFNKPAMLVFGLMTAFSAAVFPALAQSAGASDASYLAALDTLLTDDKPTSTPQNTVVVTPPQLLPEAQPGLEACQQTVAAQFASEGQSLVVGSDDYLAELADCMLVQEEVAHNS